MRIYALLTIFGNIICFPLILTASYCLQHWDLEYADSFRASIFQIQDGQILRILWSPEFWSSFPHFGSLSFLVSLDAAIYTCIASLGVFYFLRLRWNRTFLTIAVVCMLASFIPYLGGLAALGGDQDPAYVAGWHRFMLNSALYSTVLSGIFAFLHLRKPHAPRRRVRIFQGSSRNEVPPLLDISTVYLSRWL